MSTLCLDDGTFRQLSALKGDKYVDLNMKSFRKKKFKNLEFLRIPKKLNLNQSNKFRMLLTSHIVVSIAFVEENNMMPIVAGLEKKGKKHIETLQIKCFYVSLDL